MWSTRVKVAGMWSTRVKVAGMWSTRVKACRFQSINIADQVEISYLAKEL